jgi:hypothetical protein
MIVKTIARRIGLKPSSNGQLIKTDLAGSGLRLDVIVTRLPGLILQPDMDQFSKR